ncbi:MAG: hypothetical protein AB8E15_05630 [Bdellovibrionales bacterium]
MPKFELTPFMCRELIYDYVEGELGAERERVFDGFLKEDAELRSLLQQYKYARNYSQQLKKIELSSAYLNLLEPELVQPMDKIGLDSKVEIVEDNEDKKPLFNPKATWVRVGKRLTEATALAIFVFLVVRMVPSDLFTADKDTSIVLQTENFEGLGDVSKKIESEVTDELFAASEESIKKKLNQKQIPKKSDSSTVALNPLDPVINSKKTTTVVKAEASKAASIAKKESVKPTATTSPSLFRSYVYVEDFKGISDEFKQILVQNGAEKAGKVPLGWDKPKSRYFHFHIANDKQKVIDDFFAQYGNFQLEKFKHWRKVPEGKIRVIIEVRQKNQ